MTRVLAVGLDAASWPLLEELAAAGEAPALAALVARGRRWDIVQPSAYRAELAWTAFAIARDPREVGYWGTVGFDPATYRPVEHGALAAPPFFAGPRGPVTVAFDIPHTTLAADVRGLQVTAWGAHSPQYGPAARPAGLYDEIVRRFGAHPAARSDSQPGWHHAGYQSALVAALEVGAARRAEIMAWLLAREPDWELAITVFGEPHVAGHLLWHAVADGHPVAPHADRATLDRLRQVYRAVDTALGRLVDAVGPEIAVVVFALHDTQPNASDVAGLFIVPELLARAELGRTVLHNGRRPGASAGATGPLVPPGDAPVASLLRRRRPPRELLRAVHRRRGAAPWYHLDERPFDEAPPTAAPPAADDGAGPAFAYQAPTWYRRLWPRMRAFALPTFSDAQVRVNLAGREAGGIVAPEHYHRELDRLEALLRGCRDTRTGRSVVGDVERPRAAQPASPGGPPADLVVRFTAVVDAVTHPDVGTVGPFPFLRTGEHGTAGFALVAGPGRPAWPGGAFAPQGLGPRLIDLL